MVWRVGSAVRSIFSPKELGFISITYTDTHNICNSIPGASPSLSNLSIHQALTLYMRMHAEKALHIQNDKNLDVQRFIYFTILCVCLQMSVCTYVCVYRYALSYIYFKARRGHGKPFFLSLPDYSFESASFLESWALIFSAKLQTSKPQRSPVSMER